MVLEVQTGCWSVVLVQHGFAALVEQGKNEEEALCGSLLVLQAAGDFKARVNIAYVSGDIHACNDLHSCGGECYDDCELC
jgi:hypothetical protein